MANGVTAPTGSPSQIREMRRTSKLPMVLVLIFLVYLLVFLVVPEFVSDLEKMLEPIPQIIRIVTAVVLFGIFLLMILSTAFSKAVDSIQPPPVQIPTRQQVIGQQPSAVRTMEQPVRPPSQTVKPISAQATSQVKPSQPLIFTYPILVEGGIYGDTYIKITDGKTLKLRSMVVEPDQVR
jgi:predicted PurR-regulated permease PerM